MDRTNKQWNTAGKSQQFYLPLVFSVPSLFWFVLVGGESFLSADGRERERETRLTMTSAYYIHTYLYQRE